MNNLTEVIRKYGLSAKSVKFGKNIVEIKQILLEQLKQKKPVVLSVDKNKIQLTTSGYGHLVTLLEVNESKNKVFVSNPNAKDDSKKHGWLDFDLVCDAAKTKYAILILATPSARSSFESIHITGASQWYTYDGKQYCVPKSTDGSNLMRYALNKHGRQLPEQCLQWAMKYASAIFEKSVAKSSGGKKCATPSIQNLMYVAAKELMDGKPSVVRVRGSRTSVGSDGVRRWSRHYVTIVGVYRNANLNNLKETDFLILDPGGAKITQLGKGNYILLRKEEDLFKHSNPSGMPGYQIYIYSPPSKYAAYIKHDNT